MQETGQGAVFSGWPLGWWLEVVKNALRGFKAVLRGGDMTTEKRATKFAAWLDDRADEQAERLRAAPSTSEARQRLRIEAEELAAIREAFNGFMLAEASPVERAFFLAGRDMRRSV